MSKYKAANNRSLTISNLTHIIDRQFYEQEKNKLIEYWSPSEKRRRVIKQIKADTSKHEPRQSSIRREVTRIIRNADKILPEELPQKPKLPPISSGSS